LAGTIGVANSAVSRKEKGENALTARFGKRFVFCIPETKFSILKHKGKVTILFISSEIRNILRGANVPLGQENTDSSRLMKSTNPFTRK